MISTHTQANLQDQAESQLDLTQSPTTVTTVPAEDFFPKPLGFLEKALVPGLRPAQ